MQLNHPASKQSIIQKYQLTRIKDFTAYKI